MPSGHRNLILSKEKNYFIIIYISDIMWRIRTYFILGGIYI